MSEKPQELNKVLIIQTAFIGDVILATPIIEKLHKFYPSASLDFLVKKGNESILQNHPYLNEVLVLDKKNKFKNVLGLISLIRKRQYDLVVNLHRFASSGIITAFSGAKTKTGFDKNPLSFLYNKKIKHVIGVNGQSKHEIDRNLELIEPFTDKTSQRPKLHISSRDIEKIDPYTREKYVCIAPASIWYTKQYPFEKWIELINKLPKDIHIYLLGASSDQEVCEKIKSKGISGKIISLAGELSLQQSAALMSKAILTYVNDSAPMHLASTVNANVCAIYCSTVPEFGFGPLSDFSKIVQTETILPCKPCNLHGYKICPEGHFKCANEIDSDRLVKIYEDALNHQRI